MYSESLSLRQKLQTGINNTRAVIVFLGGAKLLFILLKWTPLSSRPIIQHLLSPSLFHQKKSPGWGSRQMQRVCNFIQQEYWLIWAFPLVSGQLQLFEFSLQALSSARGGGGGLAGFTSVHS